MDSHATWVRVGCDLEIPTEACADSIFWWCKYSTYLHLSGCLLPKMTGGTCRPAVKFIKFS